MALLLISVLCVGIYVCVQILRRQSSKTSKNRASVSNISGCPPINGIRAHCSKLFTLFTGLENKVKCDDDEPGHYVDVESRFGNDAGGYNAASFSNRSAPMGNSSGKIHTQGSGGFVTSYPDVTYGYNASTSALPSVPLYNVSASPRGPLVPPYHPYAYSPVQAQLHFHPAATPLPLPNPHAHVRIAALGNAAAVTPGENALRALPRPYNPPPNQSLLQVNQTSTDADVAPVNVTGPEAGGVGGLRGSIPLIIPAKLVPTITPSSAAEANEPSAMSLPPVVPDAPSEAFKVSDKTDRTGVVPAAAPPVALATESLQSIPFQELQLSEQIGGGAFGSVYRATWGGTAVAVKVLTSSCQLQLNEIGVKTFEDEVSMLTRLRHPHICLFMGACLDPPNRAIVTELVNRGSLWDRLRDQSPDFLLFMKAAFPSQSAVADSRVYSHWPFHAVQKVAAGICKGLAYLHTQRPLPIIHRDLKSANVLLTDSFDVKICDFGLARLRSQSSDAAMTANVGTVHWMAPEVLRGAVYNESVDIYSFGILLWELLTGKCPYEGKNSVEIALGVVQHHLRPELPMHLSIAIKHCINQCWAASPAARPSAQRALQLTEQVFQ